MLFQSPTTAPLACKQLLLMRVSGCCADGFVYSVSKRKEPCSLLCLLSLGVAFISLLGMAFGYLNSVFKVAFRTRGYGGVSSPRVPPSPFRAHVRSLTCHQYCAQLTELAVTAGDMQ